MIIIEELGKQIDRIIQSSFNRRKNRMPGKRILYEIVPSPPVRGVKMLAKALGVDLELKQVDLFNKQQYSEEYLNISPVHTVPTLDDDGHLIWDSHAILIYFSDKYAKNDSMYPKDVVKRSNVNQLLFLDSSIFAKFKATVIPMYFEGVKNATDSQITIMNDSYEVVERILRASGKKYLLGDEVTIADISLTPTLTSCDIVVPIDSKKYPNMHAWMKRMEALPYYEPNAVGLRAYQELLKKFVG